MVAVGVIVGFALLAANAGLSGLAERVILLIIFSSVILAAIGLSRIPKIG